MARTDADQVKGVLLLDYDTRNSPSLTPFIRGASLIVDRVATCAIAKGKTLTAEELVEIETWLAAHAYAMSDQPYSEKKTEKAMGKFQGQTKMYLEATKYGQMAISLDPSGCLAAIASGRRRARVEWLGKVPSEQIDYVQRD